MKSGSNLFNRIAGRYQLLNTILSFGLDVRWRRKAVDSLGLKAGDRLLDVGVGPGKMIEQTHSTDAVKIGIDPERKMMKIGKHLNFLRVQGIAENLPFKRSSFNRLTAAFSVRNFKDRHSAFSEFFRVISTGGRGAVLEMSQPVDSLPGRIANWYLRNVVPIVGRLISGDAIAYTYLSRSVIAFPAPDKIVSELQSAGFINVTSKRLFGFVPVLYNFTRPDDNGLG